MSNENQERRVFISLGTRLTVPVVILVAAVAAGAYFGITRASRTTAMRSKEVAADMVVKLTALSVMPAVVFGDEVEMRRAVDDLAKNPEITDVELWPADGAAEPLASFHRPAGRPLGRPESNSRSRTLEADSVAAREAVVGPDGKTIAVLAARLSTKREAQALADLQGQILLASAGTALCLAAGILFVLGRLVVSPIKRLQRAAQGLGRGGEAVADAYGGARLVDDEVVRLAASFKEMTTAVRDREAKLSVRNAELRLILNSVDQGFLTARPDGVLLPERSRIVTDWLGQLPEELKVWELAELIDPASRAWTEMAWSQVMDGFLPLEVAIEQLPKRLVRDGRHFDLAYHPVLDGDAIDRVVIVLTDVTADVERQRALADQHEFSVLVDQFVRDRRAFFDFWSEANDLVRRIVRKPDARAPESLRRDIHTLKGNARFFGLSRLSNLCHTLEDAMQERGENSLTEQERAHLDDVWESLRRRIDPLINGATAFVEISEEEYRRLADAVARRASFDDLGELVRGLRHEPTAWRLGRARDTLRAACGKLGKTAPAVTIVHNELRLPPGRWAPFWSVFPHLLNNAADHGIESDEERAAAGKSLPGNVVLSTALEGREFVVEVQDDGHGIDWERVRALTVERGLPARNQRDLEQALLSDGFSLKTKVTETSGRGIGLAAVRTVVNALGGRVEIQSALGRGTTWRFRFPAGKLGEGAGAVESTPSSRTATG